MKTRKGYTCGRCGVECYAGVSCDSCYADVVRSLLASEPWRDVAATRAGELPGETLLDTYERIANHASNWTHTHIRVDSPTHYYFSAVPRF